MAVRKNKKGQIIDILKIIDDSISDMAAVVSLDQSQLYANVQGQWLPLRLAGDGFDRLLLIIAALIAYPDSILMIDEIDSGFHYSVYDKFWEAVMAGAKEQNCQVIATYPVRHSVMIVLIVKQVSWAFASFSPRVQHINNLLFLVA